MHTLDWIILAVSLTALLIVCARAGRYMKGVSDYLVANRCAGRYLLTLSEGAAGLGAITIVGTFEIFFNAGFVPLWWGYFLAPLGLFIALSGFVIYRYRQTRAMTMAQFIEMRYSRKFRLFFGALTFVSGVIRPQAMRVAEAMMESAMIHRASPTRENSIRRSPGFRARPPAPGAGGRRSSGRRRCGSER